MILDQDRINKAIEHAGWLKARLAELMAPALLGDHTAAEMAQAMLQIRELREAYADALSALLSEPSRGPVYMTLAQELLPSAFEREGITSFNLEAGYRVTINENYRASIKAGYRADAYGWLRQNGLSDLLIETVNHQTLSAAGHALLKEGKELPEDYFHCFFQKSTSITKIGAKKVKGEAA